MTTRARVFRVPGAPGPPWAWTHGCRPGVTAAPGRYWALPDAHRDATDHTRRCNRQET
ncbi:hypothetical protein [Streptomyces phytophilus]|uniref:hypothetical protein n=1 Tax=Streptomyces phytophilus TaxID=722715 RepID=UPI0015F03DF0|nr:hypothetical protein [Streptomyces phytophilus]